MLKVATVIDSDEVVLWLNVCELGGEFTLEIPDM